MTSRWILATILLALTVTYAVVAQNREAGSDVEKIYAENCAGCHGRDLAGGSGGSLVDDEWTHGGSDAAIAASIRDGMPDLGMPAWSGTLDEKTIRALVIYIREKSAERRTEQVRLSLAADDGVFDAGGQRFTLEEVGRDEGLLWAIDFLPDGSMLVTQRDGVLWHFAGGERHRISGTPDVWQRGQGGLLDVGVHPGYADNGWIYLSYAEHTGAEEHGRDAGMTAVVRGRIEDGHWTEQETVFTVAGEHHTSSGAHFGSRFVFADGYLFFGIGDRGRQQRAQDLDRPNGKIYRIHDDGRIPADNPFVGTPGALPAIWSYGHRNPQGLDREPATGLLWESEHGPRGGDEINVILKGRNYGWPVITYGMNYDGTPITDETQREGMEQPKLYWTPSIAVAGIDFYEGDAFPGWTGKLLAGGMASEELHLLTIEDGAVTADAVILKDQGRIRDVASGPDGLIYLLLNGGDPRQGRIVRLRPVP
jgi:glucose/arabinose dehydrogenase